MARQGPQQDYKKVLQRETARAISGRGEYPSPSWGGGTPVPAGGREVNTPVLFWWGGGGVAQSCPGWRGGIPVLVGGGGGVPLSWGTPTRTEVPLAGSGAPPPARTGIPSQPGLGYRIMRKQKI